MLPPYSKKRSRASAWCSPSHVSRTRSAGSGPRSKRRFAPRCAARACARPSCRSSASSALPPWCSCSGMAASRWWPARSPRATSSPSCSTREQSPPRWAPLQRSSRSFKRRLARPHVCSVFSIRRPIFATSPALCRCRRFAAASPSATFILPTNPTRAMRSCCGIFRWMSSRARSWRSSALAAPARRRWST